MFIGWAIGGAVVGLLAGNFMRGTVFRYSGRTGEPLRFACPQCGARRRFNRVAAMSGRCACGERNGPPPAVLELATAAALAVAAGVLGPRPELIAFGWLAVVGVALCAIDVRTHRLPNRLIYPAYAAVLISFLSGVLAGTDPARLGRSLLGTLALGGCYLLLALIAPGQLGLGDVKLAGLLGLALAWAGWRALLFGGCLAFLLSAGTSLLLLATRRITLKSAIPFGPFMLAGAALALLG